MTGKISLLVNDTPIVLDDFISRFIDHTIGGMMASLKGIGEIKTLDINIVKNKVTINLNNAVVPIAGFPHIIIKNTIVGMVSPLKGVKEISKIDKIDMSIRR